MTARIIDGNYLARYFSEKIEEKIKQLKKKEIIPGLAVILVGDNHASHTYVKNKILACKKVGINSFIQKYPNTLTEEDLLEKIRDLNNDNSVHGILVQLPLPEHMNSRNIIESISFEKDVDGFHIENAGRLMTGNPFFKPCTPYGVMKMLESENIPLEGSEAVVIGSSNIVGKPMAMLLLQSGATVTICNSKTRDLSLYTLKADIIISAAGKPNIVNGEMVKKGCVVIDVGINRDQNGKMCGDIDFNSVKEKALAVSPVPGGVGPMTIAMLLKNTLKSAENFSKKTH